MSENNNSSQLMTEKEAVREWLDKLTHAEQVYQPYYELVKKTREAYRATQAQDIYGDMGTGAYNIFWSGIETQKPFLYFKRPQPYIERINKLANPVERLACKILERVLEWNLTQFDFDSVVKYARNDYLISGCGLLFETYCPTFQSVSIQDDKTLDVIDKECVETHYVDPCYFLADTDHVGVWEDVTWIAKKIFLNTHDVLQHFGQQAVDLLRLRLDGDDSRHICLYEVWDKTTRRIYWISPSSPDAFIKVADDPFHLTGFFPCPKPIFATLSNDSLIPVPDYAMIRQMMNELNGITDRMRLTLQAIKVSGVYDNAFHRLADIFEKDVTLVSLSEFDKLKEAGGIRGVIDFVPIEQYVTALEQLARRREDVIQRIFEITGVSDIMRGNSNAQDTATAVEKKTNFGTLRNQERQNDMQRFIADLYRLKAEMICACFSAENLAQFVDNTEGYSAEMIDKAVHLLKSEKLRGMLIHVESTGVVNADKEIMKTLNCIQTITQLVKDAVPTVSAQPLLLPLYRQMIGTVVAQMPQARVFESVLDQTFTAIQTDLSKPSENV